MISSPREFAFASMTEEEMDLANRLVEDISKRLIYRQGVSHSVAASEALTRLTVSIPVPGLTSESPYIRYYLINRMINEGWIGGHWTATRTRRPLNRDVKTIWMLTLVG